MSASNIKVFSISKEIDKITCFDDILHLVGARGWYNITIMVCCSIAGLLSALQVMGSGFLGTIPENYWCDVEALSAANWSATQIRNFASVGGNRSCEYHNYNFTSAIFYGYDAVMANSSLVTKFDDSKVSCTRRYFEHDYRTIVTEWDLVCDNLVSYSTTYSSVQIGKLVGSLGFGYIIAKFGRRKSLLASTFLYVPSAFLTAAATNVFFFSACRFFTQIFISGMYFSGFVLTMELCTLKDRSLASSYFVLPWAVGYMLVAGVAYFIRDWRYLQVALSTPSLVMLVLNTKFVTESPRWLCQHGRHEKALKVLKKIATKNNRELPPDDTMVKALMDVTQNDRNEGTSSDSCFNPKEWARQWIVPQLQWKTLVVFFIWLAASMVYYGVSQGASNLGLNEYVFVFFGGALEIMAYLLLWPGVKYLGSRTVIAITFGITSVCLFGIVGLQAAGEDGTNTWLTCMSYTGKFMISAAFHAAYIVTGELFSTNLRSLVMGESSVCARFGSISSPYINNLMGKNHLWAPSAFFGAFSFIAAITAALLPQTKDITLDDLDRGINIEMTKKLSNRDKAQI